jgi:Ulp1 family protease
LGKKGLGENNPSKNIAPKKILLKMTVDDLKKLFPAQFAFDQIVLFFFLVLISSGKTVDPSQF